MSRLDQLVTRAQALVAPEALAYLKLALEVVALVVIVLAIATARNPVGAVRKAVLGG